MGQVTKRTRGTSCKSVIPMIEREIVEDLIKLMIEHDLVELDLADGDQSVLLRRAGGDTQPMQMMQQATAPVAAPPATPATEVVESGTYIKSPMVGTYYSRSNPDADPFISVGSSVSDSSVVCLVEAMKVFNEIKAECAGKVVEVLVADGDPVEYGQNMFRIE